jgi:hypothetical protein
MIELGQVEQVVSHGDHLPQEGFTVPVVVVFLYEGEVFFALVFLFERVFEAEV